MDAKIVALGKEVVSRIFQPERFHIPGGRSLRTDISIFLCGGKIQDPRSLRSRLRERIEQTSGQFNYRVYFPEQLFLELILGHERRSLLTLENLLARCVSAVAIIVESPGTLTELGAFANHSQLAKKLIVIMDERYRTHQSFVNMGPIRTLKSLNRNSVIYDSFDSPDFEKLSKKTCEAARQVAALVPPTKDLSNPIEAMRAYLALIYVLEPVYRHEIFALASHLAVESVDVRDSAATSISSLIAEGSIVDAANGLAVLPEGKKRLFEGTAGHFWTSLDFHGFGRLRLQAMNLRLRRLRRFAGRNTLSSTHHA